MAANPTMNPGLVIKTPLKTITSTSHTNTTAIPVRATSRFVQLLKLCPLQLSLISRTRNGF